MRPTSLPSLLSVVAAALLAGATSTPVPSGPASPVSTVAAPVTLWTGWVGVPGIGQPLLYPIAALPAPAHGAAEAERPLGRGPAPRQATGGPTVPGPVSSDGSRALRPPYVFGAAGADRCRLVCVYRL